MPRKIEPNRGEAGFTLLETIVALVVLAVGLMAFYSFLVTMFHGADRLQAASTAFDRHANALELAKFVNPMETPDGTLDLGTYRIRWTSQIINKVRQGSRYPVGSGLFKVALYHLTFNFPDDASITPIEIEKLGYIRSITPLERQMQSSSTAAN
jgi:general secretion pathway protein I